jgi:enediyne biosynthesis protein E3
MLARSMRTVITKTLKCILGIDPAEVTLARRGFSARSDAARQHLETAGRSFLEGYHAALQLGRPGDLACQLDRVATLYRGFAYEGAAMALALVDHLLPIGSSRWQGFLKGPGAAHRFMLHVGYGWAMARLPWLRRGMDRRLPQHDPLLRWLIVDGYGFHEGYFYSPRYVAQQAGPRQLTGYSLRAFDQGLGRSLWFISAADGPRLVELLAKFHACRLPDLWSGIGLACTYAGIAEAEALQFIFEAAGPYRGDLAQGASFAAKARQLAGNPAEHTDRACRQFCGLDAESAALVSDDELRDLPAEQPGMPAYDAWRSRIRERVGSQYSVASTPYTVAGEP